MKPYYAIRKWVTFGDTNAMQNLYFATYFQLQGQVREEWLATCVPQVQESLQQGIVLSTKTAHMDYIKPFFTLEELECRMHFEALGLVRVKLVFEFYRPGKEQLHAKGWQLVVFKDANRRTCAIPENFLAAIKQYLWEEG